MKILQSSTKKWAQMGFLFFTFFILLISCKKKEDLPILTTSSISKIASTTATSGGNITSDGGADIMGRGVCWSTNPSASLSDNKTDDGPGMGNFTSNITGLQVNTKYYIRAYATNKVGTQYGNELTFTTTFDLPKVTTTPVSNISYTTAKSGGNITSDGGTTVIARGICWSTRIDPTINDEKTIDGAGGGYFNSSISGLSQNTLYYIRAYATNSVGTSYGMALSFKTVAASPPTLTTKDVTAIYYNKAKSGGNISFDGGAPISEFGICWKSTPGPTISDFKTIDGSGTKSFTSALTGLSANTKYYIRAYAINLVGTSYGDEKSFITSGDPILPDVNTIDASPTSTSNGYGSGMVVSEGNSSVLERGLCWSTFANPTISNNRTHIEGEGTGSFTLEISGLSANTTYHVRAYATNIIGTSYGSNLVFKTDPLTVSDNDGNTYNVIRIYGQVWMKENLKTTRLNDNSALANVTNGSTWSTLTSPSYVWYNNEVANKNVYGALYNWHAVSSGKLCPAGWHIPTDDEWYTLVNNLEGESPAGGKLKETGTTHWNSPNTGATNESNYTALPGGWRRGDNGTFESLKVYGYWWTSTSMTTSSWFRRIWYNDEKIYRNLTDPKYGMSIRCIMD